MISVKPDAIRPNDSTQIVGLGAPEESGKANNLSPVDEKDPSDDGHDGRVEEAKTPRIFKRPEAPLNKSWRSTYQRICHIAAGVPTALQVAASAGDTPHRAVIEKSWESRSASTTAS